ncbi:MAG: hypothetical protein RBT80_23080 [Candidatus Vecturithrix sp.]|jgi:hypothetical protein|nr:hypothetical protein [Candidatus Vecturithrix sp.]
MDMKPSNPLNNIAANLGVTPKVLTQLATGDDREFRELVRGILGMLPENEVILVASDPGINPEFLDYLSRLFEANRKVLLAILQNPSATKQTKRYILERLPEELIVSLAKNSKLPAETLKILTEHTKSAVDNAGAANQAEEFKIKMKVSKLLNDLEANLGVTIDAFLQIRTKDDDQSLEFVREVYQALPEQNVLLVARDANSSPKILNYLSRLFDTNQKILLTILHNSSADKQTRLFILDQISEKMVLSLAGSTKTPADLLALLGEHFTSSIDILATLLANPSTPFEMKERIQSLPVPEESPAEDIVELRVEDLLTPSNQENEGISSGNDEMEAKIALCVDRLYDINADIVTEFIKKARAEILKRLNLIAKANRLILRTIVQHPSLSIEELENINMDMFASLLKQSPDDIDDQTVLKLIQQAKIQHLE